MTTERLRAWAIAAARLELDSGTEDPRSAEVWWRAHNATSRALRRLEERVRDLGLDRVAGNGNGRPGDLARYVSERYGGSEGER